MTNVPGLFALTWSAAGPFTIAACKLQRYDVHASSGVGGTKVVSLAVNWRICPFAVFVMVISYVHGPGGRVTPGLLQVNVGWRVNNTSLTLRVGLMRRNQLRTGNELICSLKLPSRSKMRPRKKTTVRSGNRESAWKDAVRSGEERTRKGVRKSGSSDASRVRLYGPNDGGPGVPCTRICGAGEMLSLTTASETVTACPWPRLVTPASKPTTSASAAWRRRAIIP